MKSLIQRKSFGPYFWTSTLGAFTDNLFKNLVIFLLVYGATEFSTPWSDAVNTNLVAGLFILPFALFSGLGGTIARQIEPARLMVLLKLLEVFIMALASFGFILQSSALVLLAVFLMGTQSALYGPIKYAYIPKVIEEAELTQANAYVESGTFLAILGGTVCAGLLSSLTQQLWAHGLVIIGFALLGWQQSRRIPPLPTQAGEHRHWPQLQISDLWTSSISAYHDTQASKTVRRSVLAISSFWFTGALVLSNLPTLGKLYFQLNELGLTLFLTLFSIGVGIGSFLAERWSHKHVEIGLVPLGALGIVVCLLCAWHSLPEASTMANPLNALPFAICLFALGLSGGLFVVPLYAVIQLRTPLDKTASVVAYTNIQNSVFMVLSALLGVLLSALGFELNTILLAGVLFNLLVCYVVFKTVPEFMARFLAMALVNTIYRYHVWGDEHFPKKGAAYVTPNHISWIDSLLIAAACKRPMRFVMYYKIYNSPLLNWLFKSMNTIPIAGKSEDLNVYQSAIDQIAKHITSGGLICIFPEGALTQDGTVAEFRPGLLKMLKNAPAPVIPVGISKHIWASPFSKKEKSLCKRIRNLRWGRPIHIRVGQPIENQALEMQWLRQQVVALTENQSDD